MRCSSHAFASASDAFPSFADTLRSKRSKIARCHSTPSSLYPFGAIGLVDSLLQAAAAARIAGKDNIWDAAANGDLALVKDHLVLQPALLDQGDSFVGFDP